jgi:hypothetical protein
VCSRDAYSANLSRPLLENAEAASLEVCVCSEVHTERLVVPTSNRLPQRLTRHRMKPPNPYLRRRSALQYVVEQSYSLGRMW